MGRSLEFATTLQSAEVEHCRFAEILALAFECSAVGRLGGLQIAEPREGDTEVVPSAAEPLVDFGGDLELLTRFLPRR